MQDVMGNLREGQVKILCTFFFSLYFLKIKFWRFMESCKEDRVPIYPKATFPYEYFSVACLSQFSKPVWTQYYQTHATLQTS